MNKLCLALSILPLCVQAEVYKCVSNGKTVYQSQECPNAAAQKEIPIETTPPEIIENAQNQLNDALARQQMLEAQRAEQQRQWQLEQDRRYNFYLEQQKVEALKRQEQAINRQTQEIQNLSRQLSRPRYPYSYPYGNPYYKK